MRKRPFGVRRACSLTPSSEIALRAYVDRYRGRESVTLAEVLTDVRKAYPIMGPCVTRRDIALQLRKLGFLRDHARRDSVAYRNYRR